MIQKGVMNLLSHAYGVIIDSKNFLYDRGFIRPQHLRTPVISIGNLTVGGTGKTPLTRFILDYYIARSFRPAVVARNYKAQVRVPSRVDISKMGAANYFGDEPTMVAMGYPDVGVFVGAKKWKAACLAEKLLQPDILLVDDGFQHRALERALDLVLLDATFPLENYALLPRGLARERFSSLDRADFVFLTKTNLASRKKTDDLRKLVPIQTKVLEVTYQLRDHNGERGEGIKAVAIAGLACPESFQSSIQKDTLYELVGFMGFPDHYEYTRKDMDKFFSWQKSNGAEFILLTEKDWVKIRDLISPEERLVLRVLSLTTYISGSVGELQSSLDEVIRRRR